MTVTHLPPLPATHSARRSLNTPRRMSKVHCDSDDTTREDGEDDGFGTVGEGTGFENKVVEEVAKHDDCEPESWELEGSSFSSVVVQKGVGKGNVRSGGGR